MKFELVDGLRYETYKNKEVKKELKEQSKEVAENAETEEEEEDVPVPLITHVNNVLHSIFSDVDMYIKNQQIYKSNRLYVQKFKVFINFKEVISEYKAVRTAKIKTQEIVLM